MSKLILSLSLVLSLSFVSSAFAGGNRHEFRDSASKTRHGMFYNTGLDCQSPMVVFVASSVIVTRDADIQLNAKETLALRNAVNENGSALVCVSGGSLIVR